MNIANDVICLGHNPGISILMFWAINSVLSSLEGNKMHLCPVGPMPIRLVVADVSISFLPHNSGSTPPTVQGCSSRNISSQEIAEQGLIEFKSDANRGAERAS